MTTLPGLDLQELRQSFARDGFAVARQLFSPAEVTEIRETFEEIHRERQGRDSVEVDGIKDTNDPLFHFPRVLMPHRYNAVALRYLIHPSVAECLRAILEEEPVATQSMYYFKPPGARGQAMHQDNLYLLVEPGTCLAAWTAIDRADRENGGMMVVPGSHRENIICQQKTDLSVSFTGGHTPIPKGLKPVDVTLEPGDTLFFGGALIHGSGPNRTKDRFRRSFIGHYAAGSLDKISKFYKPLINMDGTERDVAANESGGPCGHNWAGSLH